VKFLIKTCTQEGPRGIRIVWIRDTLSLDSFYVSEGLAGGEHDPALTIRPRPHRATFDADGVFTGFIEEKS
jgi:hypothetical protein